MGQNQSSRGGFQPWSGKQKYEDLKEKCLKTGRLWKDPKFLADDSSIFFKERPPHAIEWKRPSELSESPQLFVGGASRFDIKQGELGDCWLLAATASLTLNTHLLHRVVPPDQSFQDEYFGCFKFRFWQFGKWIEICVDDRLPTWNNKLVYLHSAEVNEFWSALLEKAYAKMYGSYEALKGGNTCEAMTDFTGGVSEVFDLKKPPPNILQIVRKAHARRSLMGCSLETGVIEGVQENGLISGHAYSITRVTMARVVPPGGKPVEIPLVRVRNPWGNEKTWKGPWSDGSREWYLLTNEERKNMNITFDDDGEFWMSFIDFAKNFTKLEICNLTGNWESMTKDGSWTKHYSAGGSRNFVETFWKNPQIRITLGTRDEDDEEDICTCIIALLQKDRRAYREEGLQLLTIGYAIYQLNKEDMETKTLPKDWFRKHSSIAMSTYVNSREVSDRFRLPPGNYVIIPSTMKPFEEAEFLLRIFSEKTGNNTNDEVTEESEMIKGKKGILKFASKVDRCVMCGVVTSLVFCLIGLIASILLSAYWFHWAWVLEVPALLFGLIALGLCLCRRGRKGTTILCVLAVVLSLTALVLAITELQICNSYCFCKNWSLKKERYQVDRHKCESKMEGNMYGTAAQCKAKANCCLFKSPNILSNEIETDNNNCFSGPIFAANWLFVKGKTKPAFCKTTDDDC